MNEELKKIAKQAFADTFLFYLQAHYYHWNVEGRHFEQDHKLFELIYEDVQEAIDTFAEHLRAIDTYAPGIFGRISELSTIKQEELIPTSEQMYSNLIENNEKVLKSLDATFDILEKNHMHGFSNFVADRMDKHNKHQWMLKSTIKK
jgi:starvation-inducible DNA-binding protein